MNREILFRGKRVDNGKWVKGYYVESDHDVYRAFVVTSAYWENDEDGNTDLIETDFCEVDPSTVGQYTGLTDKNGQKIFEGDVVKVTDDYGNSDGYDCGVGDVSVLDGLWYVAGTVHNALYDINDCRYIEVIGNIHDNPEMVGGAVHE